MSLLCYEKGCSISHSSSLYAGTRSDADLFHALSQEVLDRIPDSMKREFPCPEGDHGIDIHEAYSRSNLVGDYLESYFSLCEFLYSVDQETAEKYLPNLAHDINVKWLN